MQHLIDGQWDPTANEGVKENRPEPDYQVRLQVGRRERPSPALKPWGRPHPGGMDIFTVGDKVRTEDTVKPARFAGRTGRVVELNQRDEEVGVKFGAASRHDEPTIWFRRSDLKAGSSLHAYSSAAQAFVRVALIVLVQGV